MSYTKNITLLVFLSICLFVIFPQRAYAYIDPGSGSLIFQMIVAAILGGLLAIKNFWKKITYFLSSFLPGKKTKAIGNDSGHNNGENSQ